MSSTERRRRPRRHGHLPARAHVVGLVLLGCGAIVAGAFPLGPFPAFADEPAAVPQATANGYGPGVGPQSPGDYWGGAYTLANVSGYAYCIEPGGADPLELPADQWGPVAYPGSDVYSNGQMAALAYFAERYQGTGFNGYSVNTTAAAIAQVAYTSVGGTTPPASRAPAALVAEVVAWITTYAGPWTISLTMTPPSGSTFDAGRNYSGTITVTSATGAGVGGLQITPPPTGGPTANQISNFVWLAGTTNAAGQISFVWNIDGVPPGGLFSAQDMTVVGGAPGTTPPAYGAPGGSGGQLMMVSGASEALGTGFGGTAATVSVLTGTISIQKAVDDPAYYGPAGAVFQIRDSSGDVLDILITNGTGSTGESITLTATSTGTQYTVVEVTAPTGYQLAPPMVVTVHPHTNTVASFTGADTELISPAQLGAAKTDATTGDPLAGGTFAFAFDTTDNGIYNQTLGSCTTSLDGTCQPPDENTVGGWLAGWYQVTETSAPPGYWLDPATAVQTLYLSPGTSTVASVTFADRYLGSLSLTKSGNDTAYWSVAGAVFTATGPTPSTTTVGTLTVGPTGTTNTLTGLVPGTYGLAETTVPAGYTSVAPFTVVVTAGHAGTTTSAADTVHPGSIVIRKTDATTGSPLAGAVFDVRYDSQDNGTYDQDLGDCTTDVAGTCSPTPDDGTGYLPGSYEITELAAPPGYYLPTPAPSQTVTVTPGGTATVSFTDALLVPASFHKVATGNVNLTQLVLSGAVIDVTAGTSYGGAVVATCTTDANGNCTTATSLVSGQPYCWQEVTAPPGLQAGATGCFTATNSQGAQPITVTDLGQFVAIAVKKVDAASPTTVLAGATFDLFRADGGASLNAPTPPAGTPTEAGQTWVAVATTGTNGVATFPLQLPGYAYCVVELQAPANYVLDPTEHCTGVLPGSTATPAPVTTLTVTDVEAQVTITAHKFNSAVPDTGIPGAVYDLYAEGEGPPSGPPSSAPSGVAAEQGDRWWARGTTGSTGMLSFSVPAGYAWCFHEVTAPIDYDLDPALHCTAVITTSSPATAPTVALPETLATVHLGAHKYNARQPDTVIPGATYELVVQGGIPPGYSPTPAPSDAVVPTGDVYWTEGTTDAQGDLSFAVPAGYRWCLHELVVPSGYEPDTSFHCTAVLTTDTPASAETVALPEQPVPSPVSALPFTGGPSAWIAGGGLLLVTGGGALWFLGRRRRGGPKDPGRPSRGGNGSGPGRAGEWHNSGRILPNGTRGRTGSYPGEA